MSQREAYIKAGYSSKQGMATVDHNAYVLANRSHILTRIEELKKLAEDASIMTVTERKQILTKQARGELKDIEVTQHPNGEKTTRIRVFNPSPAVAELNKMEHVGVHENEGSLNILIQRIVNNLQVNNISVEQLSDDELKMLAMGQVEEID